MWQYDKKAKRYIFRTKTWVYIIRYSNKKWILHLFRNTMNPKIMKRSSEEIEYWSKKEAFKVAIEEICCDLQNEKH
jgi:hypothetical protein